MLVFSSHDPVQNRTKTEKKTASFVEWDMTSRKLSFQQNDPSCMITTCIIKTCCKPSFLIVKLLQSNQEDDKIKEGKWEVIGRPCLLPPGFKNALFLDSSLVRLPFCFCNLHNYKSWSVVKPPFLCLTIFLFSQM